MIRRIFLLLPLATLPCAAVSPASAAEQAGVSAAVFGNVAMLSQAGSAIGRAIGSGEPIHIGDRIKSGSKSGMQIMLLDKTVFTIGADSDLTIDTFVYDPRQGSGQLAATVSQGVFRFISGRIAQNKPESMTVRLPSATIGIRGTIVAGRVTPAGAEILLLGPGPSDNSNARQGRIEVRSASGQVVEIARPGFGTVVGMGQAPLPAFRFPPAALQLIVGGLSANAPPPSAPPPGTSASSPPPPNGNAQQPPPPAGTLAGQTTADALVSVRGPDPLPRTIQMAQMQSLQSLQTMQFPMDAITTFDQLRTLTGTGTFSQTGVPIVGDGSGSYNFSMNVDFTNRNFSYVFSNITTAGAIAMTNQAVGNGGGYAAIPGPAVFFNPTTVPCGAAQCTTVVQLINSSTTIAKQAQHAISITQGPLAASGGGIAAR